MAWSRRRAVSAGAMVVVAAAVGTALALRGGDDGPKDLPCESGTSPMLVASGQLCAALKNAGLPAILGVPHDKTAFTARESEGIATDPVAVTAESVVGPYAVWLTWVPRLRAFDDITRRADASVTVAGHPAFAGAVLGVKADEPSCALDVAFDKGNATGYYEVTVILQHVKGTDADARRLAAAVAEKVLPTMPDWRAQ